MCGQDGHLHETTSRYDHATGVMRFIQKCVLCVWSRVVHEETYVPAPDPTGNNPYLDGPALSSFTQSLAKRSHLEWLRLDDPPLDSSVRRAA